MSESENRSPNRPVITPSEFVQIVRGIASADIRARFLDAYNDPTSELHEVLLGMEEWSQALPGGQGSFQAQHSANQGKKFAERFEIVQRFVREKQTENVLTAIEAERVLNAGGSIEPVSNAPKKLMAGIARMARMLDEVQPELHAELVGEIQRREASQSR